MPTVQPIGRQRGSRASLLLITLFWIGGCQALAPRSEGPVGLDPRWEITGQAGPVSLRSPDQPFWQRAIVGVRIAPGSEVATFAGSRLELASAGDEVTASGPSRFTLPNAEHDGVRVRQDAGSLRYRVRSAPKRHFEVKTPHFSTVVKGTAFLVSIDRASSAVSVGEGRVLIVDVDGEPLAELTAGQTGRLAAHPGATLEVGTAADPSLESSAEPAAGIGPAPHGSPALPPTNVTRTSLDAPISEAGELTADLPLLERIGNVLGDFAAQIRTGDALTSGDVNLGNDQGGGGREQESWSKAHSRVDDGRDDRNGAGQAQDKGKGKGKGKDKDRDKDKGKGKDKGKDKGNGKSNGKAKGAGEVRGNGHGHARDKGAGGGDAQMILDGDDRGHRIAWSGRR